MSGRPVIFDMDGVLADSEGISCEVAAAVLSEHGAQLSPEDVRQRFVGMSTGSMIQTIAAEQSLHFPLEIREIVRERSLAAFQNRLRPIVGMDQLIQATSFPRCVASSSSPTRIEYTLKHIGLFDRLAPHLFSATMVERGKPAPDLFHHAARTMVWNVDDCIVVEDSKAGVEAGVAAGMTVIGLTAGEHIQHKSHAPVLMALGAHSVVADAKTLATTLSALGVKLNTTR